MPRRRTHSILFFISLFLIFVVSGCGGGGASPSPAKASTAPSPTSTPAITPLPTVGAGPLTCTAPTTPPFPPGDYTPTDAQGNLVDTSVQGPITFQADGNFNRTGTLGCFAIVQRQITFTDQVGSFNACTLSTQTGAYTWAFDGKLLSFTLVNDYCYDRSHALTHYKWTVSH